MGVQGLWKLLDKSGREVTLESLAGKRLAIDISLWLCQAAAGYNTYSFGTRSPHIQLLISRIGKLLYYRIHPIFVFDGKNVPVLKKQVLKERSLRRHMDDIRLSKKQRTMLEQLAKQQLNSSDPSQRLAAEQQLWEKLVQQRAEDRFELPDMPAAIPKRKPDPQIDSSGSQDDDIFNTRFSSDSSSQSDEDDFVDVSDDDEVIQAIYESFKSHRQQKQPQQAQSNGNNTNDDFDLPLTNAQLEASSSTQQNGRVVIDQQTLDLRVLNERTKNGIANISQRINMKSLKNQPKTGYVVECDAESSQSNESPKKEEPTRKRKSLSTLNEDPSPKKSVLPRAAGTAEDDWLPESVAEASNAESKKVKLQKLIEDSIDLEDNEIQVECQQMLALLGLPYLIANGEAEAQCVELERLGLCDGVVTDDSDAWLFGVHKCYKNMFSRRANVEEFDLERVRKELGLFRTKFVAIGMLAGGDYCHGFDGVGCVTALKIIKEVGDLQKPESTDDDSVVEESGSSESQTENEETYEEGFERLQRIRTWLDAKAKWEAKNKKKLFREPKVRKGLRKTIETKNEETRIESFPSPEVYEAYMRPNVNSNSQHFRWQPIQFDELHEFLCLKIGWDGNDLKLHTYGGLDRWNEFVQEEYGQ